MFKNKPVLLLLGAIGVFVIIILSCIIYISVAWKGKIVPGVQVEWIEVGGLTQDEAEQKISEVQQEFLSAPVEITASEERVSLSRGELGFSIDAKKPAQQAYQVGREGSISKRISQTWYAYHKQVVIPCPEVMIDTQQVESILASFSEGLDEPQDARLIIDDRDQITIIPSKTGIAVDLDVSLDDLKLFKQPFAGEIELQYKEELPKVSTADIEAMGINGIISSFTTKFDASNYNRSYNIALAAKALNNTLIKPGEVFSFNKRVGPRTAKSGYREAIIIESNVFVPGLGGGVCQVSSTLYNTVLLAGLEITERSNHSLAITYVPLGRDAAVSYGYQDLKFSNNAFPRPLSEEDEAIFLRRLDEGDEEARNILIEHNLRLVAHIIKKFDGVGEDADDLISIGTIGLIKAINTFNTDRGTKLATYAARCIENEILMTRSPGKMWQSGVPRL